MLGKSNYLYTQSSATHRALGYNLCLLDFVGCNKSLFSFVEHYYRSDLTEEILARGLQE